MLILSRTRKPASKPCCGSCAEGGQCADRRFASRPSGLLLPDRRVIAPRSLLGMPAGEMDGARFSWNRPLLMPQIDFNGAGCNCCSGAITPTCCEDQLGAWPAAFPLTLTLTISSACCPNLNQTLTLHRREVDSPTSPRYSNSWSASHGFTQQIRTCNNTLMNFNYEIVLSCTAPFGTQTWQLGYAHNAGQVVFDCPPITGGNTAIPDQFGCSPLHFTALGMGVCQTAGNAQSCNGTMDIDIVE